MGYLLHAPLKLSLLFFAVRGYAPTTSAKWLTPSLDQHVSHQRTRSDPRSLPFLRETQLYSRSSQGHLRIINRRIDARGKDGDPYAKLILESDNFGRVKIKGAKTNHYLCIKKDGRLTGRKVAKGNKSKCVFYEGYATNSFTEFSSAFNPKWMITVSKKGHTRPGFKGRSGRTSVQFIQRSSKIIIEADMASMKTSFFDGLRQHIRKLLRAYRAKYGRLQSSVPNQKRLYKSRIHNNRHKAKRPKERKNRKKNRKHRKRNRKRKARRLARKKALRRISKKTRDPSTDLSGSTVP